MGTPSEDKRSPIEILGLDPWEIRPYGWEHRLNLAAGNRVYPAWTNHDRIKHSDQIDKVWDLNDTPWTCFEDNQFTRVEAWAILEHLKLTLLESMDEIWRILRPGGTLHVKVPHRGYYKAYRDPTHRWFGWDEGVWTFFDPRTTHGKESSYYTDRKWQLLDRGYTDRDRVAIWAKLRKTCTVEQWEVALTKAKHKPPKRVIWFNGRSQAGKSTVCQLIQAVYPNTVIVDDHYLWRDVWRYTYAKSKGKPTAERGVDHFDDERKESWHRDFAIECAQVAMSLADQGHTVFVSMIASPKARRDRIAEICNPVWVYIKRDKGEHKTPTFDKMGEGEYTFYSDHDDVGRHASAAVLVKQLVEAEVLP